jgi:hypothetical protein
MAYSLRLLILALLILHVPLLALAAVDMEELLPPVSCGSDWKIEGKLSFYDRETLSDRINGEAELYFPYGFDRMAAARYDPVKKTGAGMDVEIYRMGSLLDAFGMYANYKQKEGRALGVGAESNLSGSQLFLYQGRYFVHLQVTGNDSAVSDTLAECAKTVASRLPGDKKRPPELSIFNRPEISIGTERYLPQSLLGYDFLNRGIMADTVLTGTNLQIFLLLGTTTDSASAAFERYRSELAQGKIDSVKSGAIFLEGVDPLYGPVIILKKGNCFAGALKFRGKKGIRALLESVCR